jgi:hypothetical protein
MNRAPNIKMKMGSISIINDVITIELTIQMLNTVKA